MSVKDVNVYESETWRIKYTRTVKDFKWKGAAPWILELVIVLGNKVHTPEINIVFGGGRG
jgi:hypothetical protein